MLAHDSIRSRLDEKDMSKRLVVTPLLDPDRQVGLTAIDLRLGTRFKVDLRTREPYIGLVDTDRPVSTFFDETYRDFGEVFVLYPGQLVLASTFEYVRLPNDLVAHLASRSSLNRLGIAVYSIVQPGYSGVLTLELTNSTSNPVALVPGMRIAQLQFHILDEPLNQGYTEKDTAKYIGNTEPKVSEAASDVELTRIPQLSSKHGTRL